MYRRALGEPRRNGFCRSADRLVSFGQYGRNRLLPVQLPIAPDRRRQDRVLTNFPIRIVGIDSAPAYYPGDLYELESGRRRISKLRRDWKLER